MGEAARRKLAERREMLALCQRAGIEPDEMMDDPEHGLVLSPSGVRKLCALAPDQEKAQAMSQMVSRIERNGLPEAQA